MWADVGVGYAQVEFEHVESPAYAVAVMHGVKLFDQPISVTLASIVSPEICLQHLPENLVEDELATLVSTVAPPVEVAILGNDHPSGVFVSHRIGFASFRSSMDAADAILLLNQCQLCDELLGK